MKYTINNKEYSEFDINKRCAELLDLSHQLIKGSFSKSWRVESSSKSLPSFKRYDPCNNPQDTWPIIEKCWDELVFADYRREVTWDAIMYKHNCTKLVAACIALIELNES